MPTVFVDEGLPFEQALTLSLVIALQQERLAGYDIQLVKKWFPVTDLKTLSFIGSFAITSPAIKKKWIMGKHAWQVGGGWVTPADLARDYLRVKYPNRRKRMTTLQYNALVKVERSAPLHCEPCHIEHGFYIDLKSAYWTILRLIGWDTDYMPGQWFTLNSDMEDFPFGQVKLARNSLVSVGLPGKIRVWTGERLDFWSKPNPFINLMLWGAVQDILNGVASDAVRAGAKYVFTDGYIVDAEHMPDVMEVIHSWGLLSTVKAEGETEIRQVGVYRVGEKVTRRFKGVRPYAMSKIEPVYKDWLRNKLYQISRWRRLW